MSAVTREGFASHAPTDPTIDVVRIIARLNVGGPALHVIGVGTALEERYRTALLFGAVGAGEADMRGEVSARGLRAECIEELGRRVHIWYDLVAFVRIVRYLRAVRPRIVHTHTAKAGTLGRIAAVLAGVPIRVHTYHGHVFDGYFGRLGTAVVIAIERMLGRISTSIVVISPLQAADITERHGICARDKVRVIPLGLELGRFAPARSSAHGAAFRAEIGAQADDAVITIVGRLVPIKNHDLFLAGARELLARGHRCVFVVVGGGEEAERLHARATALGIAGAVRFLGWRTDLDAVYAGSNIVALTSHNEGTPVSLIEALAAGRAVVATAVGGVPDLLEHGRLGKIVTPNDVMAYVAALERLITHAGERAEFEERGPSAAAHYNLQRLADDLGDLYDQLAGRNTVPMRVIPNTQRA